MVAEVELAVALVDEGSQHLPLGVQTPDFLLQRRYGRRVRFVAGGVLPAVVSQMRVQAQAEAPDIEFLQFGLFAQQVLNVLLSLPLRVYQAQHSGKAPAGSGRQPLAHA